MQLSVADIDWGQLDAAEADLLRDLAPRLEDGFTLAEIADQDGLDMRELELAWENLAARVMALSGHVELPPLSDEEFAALKQSIADHGQTSPILRGSPASGLPGEIVDGHHRLRICNQLRIAPLYKDVDGTADQLRSLGLVLNLARRHLSTSSRRGIVKAELLRDPTRSDRAIASFAGVSPTTVGTVRRELEHAGTVSKLDTRTGRDGVTQPAQRTTAPRRTEPPRDKTIKVAVPIELFEQWVGGWVHCRAFRLAERRAGTYELEVQHLDATLADAARVAAIESYAADLAAKNECTTEEATAQLLRTACEVFARNIATLADLTDQEADWLVSRVGVLMGTSA